MSSVNKVILIGRLGADPEIRYTNNGKAVSNFSVATSEGGRDNQRTEWHRIVAWEKTAELCAQYLAKGRQVYIEGRLQTREWEDKGGGKRKTTEVVAQRVQFLGSKDEAAQPDHNYGPPPMEDDDVPF